MEELNKKIALFGGCHEAVNEHTGLVCWWWPNGYIYGSAAPPSFSEDIKICFEYIVPKVFAEFGKAALEELLDKWVEDILRGITRYDPKEVALALCRAVEKLIDD